MCPPFLNYQLVFFQTGCTIDKSHPNPPAGRPGTCLLRLQHDDAQRVTVVMSFLVDVKQGPRKRCTGYSRSNDHYELAHAVSNEYESHSQDKGHSPTSA